MQACALVGSHWQKCQCNKKRCRLRRGIVAQVSIFAFNSYNGIIFGFHFFFPFQIQQAELSLFYHISPTFASI